MVVIDAVTFVAIAAAMCFVTTPTASLLVDEATGDTGDAGVRTGLAEITARPVLTAYVAVQSLAQVAFNAFPILFIVFVVDELGGNGSEVGIIRGTAAFGGIAASLLVARVARRFSPPLLMMWGLPELRCGRRAVHQCPVRHHRAVGVPGAVRAVTSCPPASMPSAE